MGTVGASALETLPQRNRQFRTRRPGAEPGAEPGTLGEDHLPYMVCVCSGYWVVDEDTRLGCPWAGGAIILPLLCRTGLNTCCP